MPQADRRSRDAAALAFQQLRHLNRAGMVRDPWPCTMPEPILGRLRAMRGLAKATLVAIVIVVGALRSAPAQQTVPIVPNVRVPPPGVVTHNITPLGWFVIGSIGCAAVSPMIATVILGRELTLAEAHHTTLGCMLGPLGWLLADAMFPPAVIATSTQQPTPPRKPKKTNAA